MKTKKTEHLQRGKVIDAILLIWRIYHLIGRLVNYLNLKRIKNMEYEGKVSGTVVSKSNSYRIITINGHGSLTKTTAMKKYEESFLWQVGVS